MPESVWKRSLRSRKRFLTGARASSFHWRLSAEGMGVARAVDAFGIVAWSLGEGGGGVNGGGFRLDTLECFGIF